MRFSTLIAAPALLIVQAAAINVDFTAWHTGFPCQGKASITGRTGLGSCLTLTNDQLTAFDSFKTGALSGGGFIPDPTKIYFYEKADCKGKLRDRNPRYYDAATQCIGVQFRSFEII